MGTLHSRAHPTTKKILVWICALGLLHTATARHVNEIEVSGASYGCNGTYERVEPNPNDRDNGVRFEKKGLCNRQIVFKPIKFYTVSCKTCTVHLPECIRNCRCRGTGIGPVNLLSRLSKLFGGKNTCSECNGEGRYDIEVEKPLQRNGSYTQYKVLNHDGEMVDDKSVEYRWQIRSRNTRRPTRNTCYYIMEEEEEVEEEEENNGYKCCVDIQDDPILARAARHLGTNLYPGNPSCSSCEGCPPKAGDWNPVNKPLNAKGQVDPGKPYKGKTHPLKIVRKYSDDRRRREEDLMHCS